MQSVDLEMMQSGDLKVGSIGGVYLFNGIASCALHVTAVIYLLYFNSLVLLYGNLLLLINVLSIDLRGDDTASSNDFCHRVVSSILS
jgi:hypothetical protein